MDTLKTTPAAGEQAANPKEPPTRPATDGAVDYLQESIRVQVTARYNELEDGEAYTLDDICGPEFWSQLFSGEQKEAGKCMKRLVESKLVRYAFVDALHEYPLYYRKA